MHRILDGNHFLPNQVEEMNFHPTETKDLKATHCRSNRFANRISSWSSIFRPGVLNSLLGMVLLVGSWGCAHLDPLASKPVQHGQISTVKEDWCLSSGKLCQAVSTYRKQNYSLAQNQFLQVTLETNNPKIRDRALLGAALSGLLQSEDEEQILGRMTDLKLVMASFSTVDDHFNYPLLYPFFQMMVELQQEKDAHAKLRRESRLQSNKVTALENELSRLTQQVAELEALFQLLEQQKRQYTQPGAIN